jgi:ABC-type transport system involved in cytochrome c biogenesis permease subunit
MALGSTGGDVVRLVVTRGGRAPFIGMGVGVVLAAGLTVGASGIVAGAQAGDPVVIGGVPVLLALTVALAMLHPVRRLFTTPLATRLREE